MARQYFFIGKSYFALGEYKLAKVNLTQASTILSTSPTDDKDFLPLKVDVDFTLTNTYIALNEFNEAIIIYKDLNKIFENQNAPYM